MTTTVRQYEFDEAYQRKIVALLMRSPEFHERTQGLIKPGYFVNAGVGSLANILLDYNAKYRKTPSAPVLVQLLLDAVKAKKIRPDILPEIVQLLNQLGQEDITDIDQITDSVSEFAQHQAMEAAIIQSVDFLQKRDFGKIKDTVVKAMEVGATRVEEYNFFGEAEVALREEERQAKLLPGATPTGITTGHAAIDACLLHGGWGREELSIYMGGAKTGKTTALIDAGVTAALHGYNVLHVTLEVAKSIVTLRADANLSEMLVAEVMRNPSITRDKMRKKIGGLSRVGAFNIHEFQTGQFKPSELRRLIQHYKARKGITHDLVIVDYLDIMAPERWTNDDIANSKSIWVDVRAIAQEHKLAILSATQTNRDGHRASVAKAEHAADDFNKIRIADVVISINRTEEEVRTGEARLYFAASRNQRGAFAVHIKQDIDRMSFIKQVTRIDG